MQKKVAETFRQACNIIGMQSFYLGDLDTEFLEKYSFDTNQYIFAEIIKDFPFVSLSFNQTIRYEDKRTNEYDIFLTYGNLIPSNRINTIFELETAENILIDIYQKAKEISNTNGLLISRQQTEYIFSNQIYKGNQSYFLVSLQLNIITT